MPQLDTVEAAGDNDIQSIFSWGGFVMAATAEAKRHAAEVVRALRREYPDATCSLDFRTPLELLVATILSAQCTDQRVNQVTPPLFRKYPSAARYADAPTAELEKAIQSTGFFRNKAKNIQAACRVLVEQYAGEVPNDMESLVKLPGVGRKTANVLLGTAFGIAAGIAVDTHVARQPPPGTDRGKRPREDRKGPHGVDSAERVDRVQPSHDPAWPPLVRLRAAKVRRMSLAGNLAADRRRESVA